MTKRNGSKVTPMNVSVRHDQKAAVRQYARDHGLVTMSEAARHILDEWARMKAREAGVGLKE